MENERLFFLPGNGHGPMRLRAARQVLEPSGTEIIEARYSQGASFDTLLDGVVEQAQRERIDRVYATGIGGLVALALRARGYWRDVPLVLQGAVLWGLEHRLFPRVMKHAPMPWLLAKSFGFAPLQRHFVAKYFESPLDEAQRREFFAGYGNASAFAHWFRWLNADLLRELEGRFDQRQDALEHIEFWWGEKDRVVGVDELRVTERALGRSFALRTFSDWGHYPMIDDPVGWAKEVIASVEDSRTPA